MPSGTFDRFRVRRLPLAIVASAALLAGCGPEGQTSAPVASAPPPPPSQSPAPSSPTGTAIDFAADLSPGWNLGNSLEAIGQEPRPATGSQETAWGNPAVTQALLDAVADAGFKSVRIPVSWNQYADADNRISEAWLDRVADVVDYARNAGLYVVVNAHWDGGWMQPTYAEEATVDARLRSFWTQIATRFRDYDDHLLFAGTNEVMVTDNYNAPSAENCEVQNGFNQVFVDAVRATGGANTARFLVVQGYNTNIDYTIGCNATLPSDTADDRLMMEVHYYDPYDFALNADSSIWQWGASATIPSATADWGDEAHVDGQFAKMETSFVEKGIPVILGEYGAIAKTEYDPAGTYRTMWDAYVTHAAIAHGMVPMYWDNGYTSNHNMGLFDRANATVAFPEVVSAIVEASE